MKVKLRRKDGFVEVDDTVDKKEIDIVKKEEEKEIIANRKCNVSNLEENINEVE